jgi:6-phosphogluconolactonase
MTIEESRFTERRKLFTALATDICTELETAVKKRRKASMALAGGTTPGPLYEMLCNLPAPWAKVTLTVTDERWVSPEDPASNEYLIRDQLLRRRAADASFIPFKTNHARPQGAAATTERRLSAIMPLDICLLGMGPDGHIASLIPGADGFETGSEPGFAKKVCAIHAHGAAGSPDRLSLTLHGILSSRRIVLLFMGQEKLNVFNEAKEGRGESPVRHLLSQKKTPVHTYWAP